MASSKDEKSKNDEEGAKSSAKNDDSDTEEKTDLEHSLFDSRIIFLNYYFFYYVARFLL